MKSWFLKSGYLKQMINPQMEKVKFGQRFEAGSKQPGIDVPFIITYHSKLKKIGPNYEKARTLIVLG